MLKGLCTTAIEFADKKSLIEMTKAIEKRMIVIISETAAVRYAIREEIQSIVVSKKAIWIKESVSYPTQKTIEKVLQIIGDYDPEIIVAIGGGSSIDLAKVVKAFYSNVSIITREEITSRLKEKRYIRNDIEIMAVPTTSGTGSEVTQWATVWDEDKKCKYSVDADYLKPDYAFIVPELIECMGNELTIATGLDSISHALEAYWSKATNPLIRALAIQSLTLSVDYLEDIVANPNDFEKRQKQAVAALISGLAFSMTRTTACHSISYPLTMDYGIPHGIAVAMTIPSVYEINRDAIFDINDLDNVFEKAGGLKTYIYSLCRLGNISLRLSDYGIEKKDLPAIVEKTFTLGRMDNNPVAINVEQVLSILLDIL